MANRFTEPDEGLEPRPEIEQREGEDDDIFALAEMAISEIRRTTDALATGSVTVEAWYEQMTDILYAYHLAGWYVGQGTDDDPTDEQMDALAEFMAQELEYLDNFRNDLLKEDADILAPTYRNRAEMYGWATRVSVWRGRSGLFVWPAYPGYRSTCLCYCRCQMDINIIDDEKGDADMTWRLGPAEEHCPECKARARDWKPFKTRDWKWVKEPGKEHYN